MTRIQTKNYPTHKQSALTCNNVIADAPPNLKQGKNWQYRFERLAMRERKGVLLLSDTGL